MNLFEKKALSLELFVLFAKSKSKTEFIESKPALSARQL
jgi:hypothetical protein